MIAKRSLASSNQQGFTIIELMIALSVMAVILVISTVVLINLGVLYTKGNNQANTQNLTRNIVNELVSQLELGSADPVVDSANSVVCLGSQRYTYRTGYQLNSANANDHALWRDTMKSSASCTPFNLANPAADVTTVVGSGAELLLPQMQLVAFNIVTPPTTPLGTYSIQVTVAYGDPTLLVFSNGRPNCTGAKGTEYCAVASLTQNVARRGIN